MHLIFSISGLCVYLSEASLNENSNFRYQRNRKCCKHEIKKRQNNEYGIQDLSICCNFEKMTA